MAQFGIRGGGDSVDGAPTGSDRGWCTMQQAKVLVAALTGHKASSTELRALVATDGRKVTRGE